MIVSRLRKRKGAWWWTTSHSRPREWHGPYPTRGDADRACSDYIHEVAFAPNFWGPGPNGWEFDRYEPARPGSRCADYLGDGYCGRPAVWRRVDTGGSGSSMSTPLCDDHYAADSKAVAL